MISEVIRVDYYDINTSAVYILKHSTVQSELLCELLNRHQAHVPTWFAYKFALCCIHKCICTVDKKK